MTSILPAMMHITEDTPPDMLEGAMDLTVHLPNGKAVKMSVERSTPMMDVLVQITTAHQLQISNYAIHALGMAPLSGHTDNILPFKANTPIGTLETQHIKVVPKNRSVSASRVAPTTQQPFESTFRLKVHLPRNQLYVHRVSKSTNLGQIMRKVCDEKNLDPEKYEFRHPGNLDEVLDPKLTLADYQITEIYAVLKGAARLSQTFSAQDIMALRKEDDRKNSKSSGGVFSMFFKRGKSNSGSLSSENRSISPSHSDDSRSGTPPATQPPLDKPKPPQRKRRPAPKPPQIKEEAKKVDHPVTICHSRNSSDSSGYHEASILSDANASLPRRPQILNEESRRSINGEFSRSTGNLATMSNQSKSTSSLALAGRKKKAPPPPPKSGAIDNASPVVASRVEKQDSIVTTPPLPNSVNIADKITIPTTNSPPESIASSLSTTLSSNIETDILPSNDEDNKITTPKEICPSPTKSSKISNLEEVDNPRGSIQKSVEVQEELQTWQYQLPSPPNAFRDDSPVVTEQTPTDSIITSPELFEKLKLVKETQSETSEIRSVASENDMYNTLSLENLEKRKSLVYNRELATSFKYSEEQVDPKKFENANNVINELEEVLANKPEKVKVNNSTTLITNSRVESRNLPNFKITTYNEPKKNINIFEDDSIRSNANDSKLKKHISMENLALRRESLDDSKKPSQDFNKYRSKTLARMNEGLARSESLTRNTWVLMNPVKRSKSQVAINYHQQQSEEEEEEEDKTNNNGLSKSNSLFDVSGLQSLEVMRKIQTTLNSTEALEENKAFKSGPPSINLGTWSDRSRSNVSSRNESTNINNNNVSIKINGSESISTRSGGNVIIKIGGETNVQLRKPLDDVKNTVERDMSRVPIVRSVELKKPFRDFHPNKSVTQICPEEDVKSLNYIMNSNNNKMNRKNSFNDVGYKTLPSKNVTKSENFSTNMNVPFSQCILRRTDSVNKLESNNNNSSNNNNNNSNNNKSNIFGNVVLRSASNANNFSKRYSTGNLDNMYSQKLTPLINSVTPRPVTQSSQRITLESTQRTTPESTQRTIVVSTEHTMGPPLQTKIHPLSQTIPRPPAPPTLPKQRPPSVTIDPRGQLLSDIINFGGKKGLRTLNN